MSSASKEELHEMVGIFISMAPLGLEDRESLCRLKSQKPAEVLWKTAMVTRGRNNLRTAESHDAIGMR